MKRKFKGWERHIKGSPIVSHGIVYVGTLSPGNAAFYAIDAVNGNLKWVFTYDYDFYSSPIVFNNVVYVVNYASVLAINGDTGTLKWKYEIDNQYEEVNTSPSIVDKNANIYYSGISGCQN